MFKRGIFILLILAVLLTPIFTVKATDLGGAWAQATAYITKEFGLDLAARVLARTLLNNLISGLISKIQGGGRNGGPAFVQNWINFQTDAQYRGENVFRSMLASATLCSYTSGSIKNLFGANTRVPSAGQNLRVDNFDPFALRTNCTMPSNFSLTNYQKDFSGNGGWNAWSRMLEPQNNYYGLLFGSLDEATKQRALAQSSDNYEALSGRGYTSIRDTCAGKGAGAKCIFLGKVFTPGDLLGQTAANTIDKDLEWFVSSDELSEVIINVVQASINRLANLALSNTANNYANTPKDNSDTSAFDVCTKVCGKNYSCLIKCAQSATPLVPNIDTSGGGQGPPPPADAATKHGNHVAEMAVAKNELIAAGRQYPDPNATDECFRFEIVERAVPKIGGGAGFLDKPSGNNCRGFAVDIIAFPDGYIYDVLSGGGDGSVPVWNPAGCGPAGGDGTCPNSYRAP